MKQADSVGKSLEWARGSVLAQIMGRGKRPRPTRVAVMPDGKVRVEVPYPLPPVQYL